MNPNIRRNFPIIAAAAMLLPLLMSVAVRAGEVENQVITDSIVASMDCDIMDSDCLYTAGADMLDIWVDTAPGSYCETYAASAFVIISTWANAGASEEGTTERVIATASLQGIAPLIEQMDNIGNRCLNEQ